jgi:taurine transport system substrate-binding protein
MKLKKFWSLLLVAMLAMSLLAACGSSTESEEPEEETTTEASVPEVVNIGVQTLVTPELIARYEGIYEEYMGCPVNLVQFDSGADVNRAFASGSIDIGAIGTSPASIGISTDLGYEVFWFEDVIGKAESLVAREGSGIETVKDLEGKKVATPFASTAHFSLQNAMEMNDVDVSKVELFDMQPDDIYAAWTRGDIDAAYVWDPVLTKLFADGGVAITSSEELAKEGVVTADLAVINKEFAETYPDVATGYIKAQIYAVDLFNSDRDAALDKIAEAIDITKEEAETQAAGFIYPTGEEQLGDDYFGADGESGRIAEILKGAADFLVAQESLDSAPDLSKFEEYSTGEYIKRALDE